MAGQRHQRPREAAIEGACGERGYAGDLDRAVERFVVVPEALVVRPVARPVHVVEHHDQPGAVVVASDPAGGLDVLGVGLRLSVHQHQPEALNVQTHRDHVGRDGAVHPLLAVVKGRLQPAPCASATRSVLTREVSSTTSEKLMRSRNSPCASPSRLRLP